MEYIKIKPTYGLSGIAKVSKYEGVKQRGCYAIIANELESIWYDDDHIKIYRPKVPGRSMIKLESYQGSLPEVEILTCKEYYEIINQLKSRKIIEPINNLKEPYMIDTENSTNTHIIYVPKPGFEVGYKKVYTLEWFNSLGAAYPMPHLVSFMNNPYEIKVNTKKYKGYRFVPEESTTEKSVYQVVWPRKREFEKEGVVWR